MCAECGGIGMYTGAVTHAITRCPLCNGSGSILRINPRWRRCKKCGKLAAWSDTLTERRECVPAVCIVMRGEPHRHSMCQSCGHIETHILNAADVRSTLDAARAERRGAA